MACLRQAEHTRVQQQTCVHGSKRRFPSDSPHRRHWADFTPIDPVLTPQPDRGNSSAEPITGLGEPPAFALTGTVADRVVALDRGDLGWDRLTERVGSGRVVLAALWDRPDSATDAWRTHRRSVSWPTPSRRAIRVTPPGCHYPGRLSPGPSAPPAPGAPPSTVAHKGSSSSLPWLHVLQGAEPPLNPGRFTLHVGLSRKRCRSLGRQDPQGRDEQVGHQGPPR
jgi:hypothetical protein